MIPSCATKIVFHQKALLAPQTQAKKGVLRKLERWSWDMKVLSLTCSQDQDVFGSSVPVSDHADTPSRERKTQTMHSSRDPSWDFYCRPVCSGNKMVQQYLPSLELRSVSSYP